MNDKPSALAPFNYALLAMVFSYLFLTNVVTNLNPLLSPDQLSTFNGHIRELTTGLGSRGGIYHPTFTLCERTQCLQVKTKNGLPRMDVAALSHETALVTVTYQPNYLQVDFPFEINCAWGIATAEHVYVDGNKLYITEKKIRDAKVGPWVSLLFGIPAALLWYFTFKNYMVLYGKSERVKVRSHNPSSWE